MQFSLFNNPFIPDGSKIELNLPEGFKEKSSSVGCK